MKFKEFLTLQEEITQSQLNYAEDIIDALWNKLGIDVNFSKHFIERLNDSRNEKPITVQEIITLFKKEYALHGKTIRELKDKEEGVLVDLFSKINIPIAINDRQGWEKELKAKTILRRKDFKNINGPTFKVN